jgi:catalase
MAASHDVRWRTGHEARHPDHRPLTELGRLEVTAISPTSAADERRLAFDPTNRTDGIDLSADPILLVRSAAYSISYDYRRKGGSD